VSRPALRRAWGVVVAAALILQPTPAPAAIDGQAPVDPPTASSPGPAPAAPAAEELSAQGALLLEPASQQVLWSRDAETARPIASLTKIMTALLAVEAETLEDVVTVSALAVGVGRQPGAASLGLEVGQQIPMRSLLAGLLMRSGNDAAVAVAEHVAGDEATFVAAMNARAGELGMGDTRFYDSSGLGTDLPNVSSPADLARLAEVALAEPAIAEWVGSPVLDAPGLPQLPNRNLLLGSYDGATGVKTGYTSVAGLCLVASAQRDGRDLVAIVLDSERSFADAARLLDHGFIDWRRAAPVAEGELVGVYRWATADVALIAGGPLVETLPTGTRASWRVILEPVSTLPVPAGQVLGRAELFVDGELRDRVGLRSAGSVAPPPSGPPASTIGRAVQEALRAYARLEPVDRSA
jgi:serine-type D-Ala-D-Ala carboxypeptidase (penicillin-binding protein 5/6)